MMKVINRYISHYYAGEGEFARSGGVYLNAGCGHFVTQKADLNAIEPVAVHEMTHACVAHLPLPVWLNEGMAVNAEQQLTVVPPLSEFTPEILHQQHVAHWNAISIQSFWSGESFLKPGEINLLSYDLARIVVRGLSDDWQRFRKFVLASNDKDAGRAASVSCLEASLGEYVCALLDQAYDPAWEPAALVAENTIADISISWSLKLDETEFKPEQQIYRCSG